MVKITKKVCNEVYDIIYHMENELFNKIPKNFINMIEQNKDENLKVNIDYSKSINEQELQKETRILLSLIYRDYLCDEEERKKLIEQDKNELKHIEEELRNKYNPDNLFNNKNIKVEENVDINTSTEIIVYKENIVQKIFKILKKLFRRN